MKEKVAVSKRLSENIAQMEEFFHECDDIKKKELMLGRQMDVACYRRLLRCRWTWGLRH